MNKWCLGRMDGWMGGWMEWMDGQMDGQMDAWMEQMDGWEDWKVFLLTYCTYVRAKSTINTLDEGKTDK